MGSNDDGTVTITEAEYTRLLVAEKWLNCLEAAGVDNWDGWDYAKEMMDEADA